MSLERERGLGDLRIHPEGLEASGSHYAALYDLAPIAHITLDDRGVIVEVNRLGASLIGRDRAQILGRPFLSLVAVPDPDAFWGHLRRCVERQSRVISELTLVTTGGAVLEVQAISAPVQGIREGPPTFSTALVDVTEHKKGDIERRRAWAAERALRCQLERLERASVAISQALATHAGVDPGPILQIVVDHARVVADAEYAVLGTGGLPGDHPFNLWVFSGVSHQDVLAVGRPIRPRESAGQSVSGQGGRSRDRSNTRTLRRGGEDESLQASFVGAPIRLADAIIGDLQVTHKRGGGAFTEMDRQCIDILAERVDAVLEILRMREVEARKRARLNLLAEASEALSKTRDRKEMTREIARLAVPRLADFCLVALVEGDELRVASVASVDPERAPKLAELAWDHRLKREEDGGILTLAWRSRSVVEQSEGSSLLDGMAMSDDLLRALPEMPRCALAIPMLTGTDLVGLLLVGLGTSRRAYDGTDRRALEDYAHRAAMFLENATLFQRATAAVNARDGLLAVVAHDLKNIINGIQMAVNVMGRGVSSGERGVTARDVELVDRNCKRTYRLINDLLTSAVIEAGRFDVDMRPEALPQLLDEAGLFWASIAAEESVSIVVASAPGLPDVSIDRERVMQVLFNLLGNAIRFTPTEGTIRVWAEEVGAEVRVSVTDDGCGIAPDDLPFIFDRYWKGRSSGSGLGLSISKAIVQAHGGRLWVDSRVGEGSTFFFTLQIAT